jgi:hypothetical protein
VTYVIHLDSVKVDVILRAVGGGINLLLLIPNVSCVSVRMTKVDPLCQHIYKNDLTYY